VIHAGYGIFFGAGGLETGLGAGQATVTQTGFSRTTTTNGSLDNGLTYPNSLANPFPTGVLAPTGSTLGSMTNAGGSITAINTHPRGLYVQRWEVAVQRELPKHVVLSVGYDGNRGTHMDTSKNLDALPDSYLSTLPIRDQNTINYLTTNIANPFYGLLPGTSLGTNTTVARTQLLIPYPQFTGVTMDTFQGYSWYHSLQVTGERRFRHGLTATGSYTWSKTMQATSFLNGGDPLPTKQISPLDHTHYLSISTIYELPIGRGRALLGNSSKLVNALLGGWQLEGVYRYQSGQALGFGNALFSGTCNGSQGIALPADQRSVYRQFNTSCFVTASSAQLSNNLITLSPLISAVRAPALNDTDLSGIKKFKVAEKVNVEFRLEFINAFNQVWLGGINTTPTSSAFGQATAEQSAPRRVYWSGRVSF
jgi:hypothetical protein